MHHHAPGTLTPTHLRVSLAAHAAIFIVVNALLIWVNLTSGSELWFQWPLLGWSAGLAYHGWAVSRRMGRHPEGREHTQSRTGTRGRASRVANGDEPT